MPARVPEGVQGGVPDRESCSLEEGRFRPNKGVRSVAGASWSGDSGRRSPVVVWSWYEGVGDLLSGHPPPQSVLCHADHFHEPPVWVSSYDATCILSVVSTCIPDGGTCMSSFAMVRSGK